MAVRDDLMAGESYFIREIRYLKRILDSLDDNRLTVCAIDEILRGTNTGERIRSSRAILEYLSDKNCIALVATHDREDVYKRQPVLRRTGRSLLPRRKKDR